MRGLPKPASRTASRTLAASALVWRFEVPEATITRSNSGEDARGVEYLDVLRLDVFEPIDDGSLEFLGVFLGGGFSGHQAER